MPGTVPTPLNPLSSRSEGSIRGSHPRMSTFRHARRYRPDVSPVPGPDVSPLVGAETGRAQGYPDALTQLTGSVRMTVPDALDVALRCTGQLGQT